MWLIRFYVTAVLVDLGFLFLSTATPALVTADESFLGGGLFSCLGFGGSKSFLSTLRSTTFVSGVSIFLTVIAHFGGVTRRKLMPCRISWADCDLFIVFLSNVGGDAMLLELLIFESGLRASLFSLDDCDIRFV